MLLRLVALEGCAQTAMISPSCVLWVRCTFVTRESDCRISRVFARRCLRYRSMDFHQIGYRDTQPRCDHAELVEADVDVSAEPTSSSARGDSQCCCKVSGGEVSPSHLRADRCDHLAAEPAP
ncbi:hypothetical protein ACFPRL_36140 [Pseudoclavibacter helvolus]